MNKLLITIAVCLTFFVSAAQNNTVHIKGELKNFASEFMMSKLTPEAQLMKEGVKITLDDENKFEVTFELTEASYFNLGRNTMYINPGDQIEVIADNDNPLAAIFKGGSSEACMYLRARPFPKAGSYLYGTDVLKGDPSYKEVGERVKKHVEAKQKELDALENVSAKFKKMENGRLMFDAANTLISYCNRKAYSNKIPKEEMPAYVANLRKIYQKDINKYVEIGNDVDYLNLGVFLNITNECIRVIGEENMDQEILDFLNAYGLIMNLRNQGPVASVLSERKVIQAKLKLKTYTDIVSNAFDKYDIIMPGELADDLNMKNREGGVVKLSDFKGKIVVIDVWATWCGPCIAESPHFEKLAEKYKDNSNLKFVAISIDTNLKAWEKYLSKHEKVSEQLVCNRTEFEKYILQGVPRFMLIGKKGEIIDVFAPKPSDPALEETIKKALM